MKTFKTFILALSLMFTQQFAKASQVVQEGKLTVENAVTSYIDAFCHGKLKGFSTILDDNATFTSKRGDKVFTYTKYETLESLRKNANIEQNCKTDFSIVESLPNQVLVKVDMKYENFTKENYITLTESNNGWKITQVSTAFK